MTPPSRLAYRRYRLTFRHPLRTAAGWWRERDGLILRWEGEGGRIGWGEAAPIPAFGMETTGELEAACAALGAAPEAEAIARVPFRWAACATRWAGRRPS